MKTHPQCHILHVTSTTSDMHLVSTSATSCNLPVPHVALLYKSRRVSP